MGEIMQNHKLFTFKPLENKSELSTLDVDNVMMHGVITCTIRVLACP